MFSLRTIKKNIYLMPLLSGAMICRIFEFHQIEISYRAGKEGFLLFYEEKKKGHIKCSFLHRFWGICFPDFGVLALVFIVSIYTNVNTKQQIRRFFHSKNADNILISRRIHMLWVLIRSASARHF